MPRRPASSTSSARRRRRPARVTPRGAAFVVVTGLSGAGKSQAIRALEDLGYFCVDNLPIALIPTFADLTLNVLQVSERFGVDRKTAAAILGTLADAGVLTSPAEGIYRRFYPHAFAA